MNFAALVSCVIKVGQIFATLGSFFVFLSNPGDLIFGRVLSESSSFSGTGLWRIRRQSRRTKVGPVLETGTPPRSQVTSISDFFGALANFSFFPRKRIPRKNHIISHKEKRTSPRSLSRPRPRAPLDLTPFPPRNPLILRNCNLQRTTLEFSTQI